MNYIWNIDIEKVPVEKNLYIARNWTIWKLTFIYNFNENLKQKWIYLYNVLNTRDWKEISYWFIRLEDYTLFLELRKKIKWLGSKIIAEFSSFSKFEKLEIIKWIKKVKWLWDSNLEKMKKVVNLENDIDFESYEKIKFFLNSVSSDEKKKDKFLKENLSVLKNLEKVEILKLFNK